MSGMRRTVSLAVFSLLVAPAFALSGGERESLQSTLRRLRRAQTENWARIESQLQPLLSRMHDLAVEERLREATALRADLVALGPDSAQLLVRHIDAGAEAEGPAKFRAEQVARALKTLASPAITNDLLTVLAAGSEHGKRNALIALANSPEPERVAPKVGDFFHESSGQLKADALDTLVRLGGPHANAMIGEALKSNDEDLVGVTLSIITELKNEAVIPEVQTFLEASGSSAHVPRILSYVERVPATRTIEFLTRLVAIAERRTTLTRNKVQILEALRAYEIAGESEVKRVVEPLGESGMVEVREAALTLLARFGDKNARHDLLKDYDRRISRQKDYARAYVERGDVYFRIGDYSKAVRDYRKANKLNGQRKQVEPYLGLARSYARMGRFKDTADALKGAPLSLSELRALADDPDFAEFKQSRYAHALRLGNDE